ncbi:serine/threonine-protein kinase RsbW [Microvirga subterranea]|uniref:Serine/threonine-protein kinase RsbW n=2 Tax=Microvirga subterranea TaxID=186651 RepID=A0A370HUN5_9HYPH|nr:serine/threonine-protein kinase RsbW [Microvirga subterranea]
MRPGKTGESTRMASSISLSIDSDLDKVAHIARAVRGVCSGLLSTDDADAVEISVVEAINNVIKHGYQGQPGQDVEVHVVLHKDQVVIDVIDHASPMRTELLDQASEERFAFDETNLDEVPEGGMGLALIQMNMDEVEYTSEGGENRLRMIKRVA